MSTLPPDATALPRRLRVAGLVLAIDEPDSVLRERAAHAVGLAPEDLQAVSIARRSLDARRRGRPGPRALHYDVQVDVELAPGTRGAALDRALASGRARELGPPARFELPDTDPSWRGRRVVVVGAGPAGLYAAWTLAANGIGVDLIERGPALAQRSRAVARFLRTRELDPERNLLFGEGGAGTYSDGKLYTRTRHALEAPIVQTLVEAGAPPEIAFDARAHVGTDRLHKLLPRLRGRLETLGVRFHFETRLEALVLTDRGRERHVRALRTSRGEMAADGVVLALGHSARDSLRALAAQGVSLEAKPFQIGLRAEHPQALIDRARLGDGADIARIGHAYYALVARPGRGVAGAHSFCMCPGGQIVAAVAQPGLLCTNGMSNSRHSSPFANAGLVVTLGPREFGEGPFAGIDYQERLEATCFAAGGGDWHVPAQRVPDFLAGRSGTSLGRCSYKLGLAEARLDELLPATLTEPLRAAIRTFDRAIPGFAGSDGLLVGVESRSSGPVRMPRDPRTRRAQGFDNLWPVGEGAGHAGGIMSAAIDGARSAWALLGAHTSPA